MLAVAGVQAAKLRRRKLVVLFGLAPFALSLLFAGPTILLLKNSGAELGPMFKFGMILGWGAFLSAAGCLLALLLGATAIERDITDATLFPVLAKPVSRSELLLGKYAGCGYVLLFYLAIEALILLSAASQAGAGADWWQLVLALAGDALRFGTFLALGLMVGVILRPAVGISLVAACAIWLMLLDPLLKAQTFAVRCLGLAALALLPHTEFWGGWFDSTTAAQTQTGHWSLRIAYVVLWGLLFLALARWRFERRELTSSG
jgi:ABC-type transport system involved in multi-copper enzyme maturation permease subunit